MKPIFLLLLFGTLVIRGNCQAALHDLQQADRQALYCSINEIKSPGLQKFFNDFLLIKDSAGLTPFYKLYSETASSCKFYTNTLKKQYPEAWLFEQTPDATNMDSFFIATENLFFKRMRWLYTRCRDSIHSAGNIFFEKAYASLLKAQFKQGDIIDCQLNFTDYSEKYARFRIYFYNNRWYIRSAYSFCGGG